MSNSNFAYKQSVIIALIVAIFLSR